MTPNRIILILDGQPRIMVADENTYEAAGKTVARALGGAEEAAAGKTAVRDVEGAEEPGRTVRHGEEIRLGAPVFRFEYTVTDPIGMHARPAGKLAEAARAYQCEITVCAGGKRASARSPIALMNLGAGKGTVLSVRAEGKDAEAAIRALKAFFQEHL